MQEYKTIKQKIAPRVATSVVVANMIGTGVFTSLGFQLEGITSVFAILTLWLVGGVIAICGALTYAELGSTLPRSGGEYHFLRDLVHPAIGFLAGWVSMTIGFAAPTALAAMTMGEYLAQVFPSINATYTAALVVILLTLIHASSKKNGGNFQFGFTILKVVLIIAFIVCALLIDYPQKLQILPHPRDWQALFTPAFAVSLIYVSYAYTGWNAAAYLIGEIKNPRRYFFRILLSGTIIVTLLYVFLNYVFLYTVPIDALKGKLEIGYIAGEAIFGNIGGKIIAITLALLLVSTTSAMIFAGPRVNQVMGEDFKMLRSLGMVTKTGIPRNAIIFQAALTLIFIFSATFDKVLVYAGLSLNIITVLTVASLFILRKRVKRRSVVQPYRLWAYPIPPLIFLSINLYTIIFIFIERTNEAFWSLITMGIGLLIFGLSKLYPHRT